MVTIPAISTQQRVPKHSDGAVRFPPLVLTFSTPRHSIEPWGAWGVSTRRDWLDRGGLRKANPNPRERPGRASGPCQEESQKSPPTRFLWIGDGARWPGTRG
mmetsp:Transcript_518/g.577  ORF Transcript_518/g.577 Transcript_518/m.577 type:complete len:102 (+) Transcript_518:90-395(+)